jgi:chromosome segregation ATPase
MDDLEKRKLELEIAEMSRPMWSRPAFITPVIAAVLSIGLGYFSGWFEIQSKQLKLDRSTLQKEVDDFRFEKSRIQKEIGDLHIRVASTQAESNTIKTQLGDANNQLRDVTNKSETAGKALDEAKEELRGVAKKNVEANAKLAEARADLGHMNEQLLEIKNKNELANSELTAAKIQLANELASRRKERQGYHASVVRIKKELAQGRLRGKGAARMQAELVRLEASLASSESAEQSSKERVKKVFGIPEQSLDEWEQEVKRQIMKTEDVDDDGCFIAKEGIDKGKQFCLNY